MCFVTFHHCLSGNMHLYHVGNVVFTFHCNLAWNTWYLKLKKKFWMTTVFWSCIISCFFKGSVAVVEHTTLHIRVYLHFKYSILMQHGKWYTKIFNCDSLTEEKTYIWSVSVFSYPKTGLCWVLWSNNWRKLLVM